MNNCDICNKSFIFIDGNMNYHEKIHSFLEMHIIYRRMDRFGNFKMENISNF